MSINTSSQVVDWQADIVINSIKMYLFHYDTLGDPGVYRRMMSSSFDHNYIFTLCCPIQLWYSVSQVSTFENVAGPQIIFCFGCFHTNPHD